MAKKSVVIINDNEEILQYGKEQTAAHRGLRLLGYAKDGMEGLNLVLSKKPEIIIVNFLMPRMNGLDLVSQLFSMLPEYQPKIYLSTSCTIDFMEDVIDKVYPKLNGKIVLSCVPDTLLNIIKRIGGESAVI